MHLMEQHFELRIRETHGNQVFGPRTACGSSGAACDQLASLHALSKLIRERIARRCIPSMDRAYSFFFVIIDRFL